MKRSWFGSPQGQVIRFCKTYRPKLETPEASIQRAAQILFSGTEKTETKLVTRRPVSVKGTKQQDYTCNPPPSTTHTYVLHSVRRDNFILPPPP